MKDGLLLYNSRLVVPNAKDEEGVPLRTNLIKEVYEQLTTTHLSKKKTLALVKVRFY